MLVAVTPPLEFLLPSTMTVSPGLRSLTGTVELAVTFVPFDVDTWTVSPAEVCTYTVLPSMSLIVPTVALPPPRPPPELPRPPLGKPWPVPELGALAPPGNPPLAPPG